MTVYAVTPVQPASTLEAIRDQSSGFLPYYLPPEPCAECWRYDGGAYDCPHCPQTSGTGTVSPVLPDQPCSECGGEGFVNDETDTSYRCPKCKGSGRVPLPLLITGEQWRPTYSDSSGAWSLIPMPALMAEGFAERRVAGLAVLDQPDWLPVVNNASRSSDWPDAAVVVDPLIPNSVFVFDGRPLSEAVISLPSPPEPGGFVVDVSGARWLDADEVITERLQVLAVGSLCSACPPGVCDRRDEERCYARVPLSPGSGGLTVVEVPDASRH